MKACKQLWPGKHLAIYKQLLEFKTQATIKKMDKMVWADADTMLPHKWYDAYGWMTELPEFTHAAMQLTSKASSASVAEQEVSGWSKVGCIESEKRTRILTSKTSKLVNVGGWQWAMKQEERLSSKGDRKDQFKLLDEMVNKTVDEAHAAGLTEGIDDQKDDNAEDDDDTTATADNHDAPATIPDLPDPKEEDYVQELASSEDAVITSMETIEIEIEEGEVEDIEEDVDEIEEPWGPRSNIKVNSTLDACVLKLEKPTIRGSLASGRALTFEE